MRINKQRLNISIDMSTYLGAKASGINISEAVNKFLKAFSEEDFTHNQEKEELQEEIEELQEQIVRLQTQIVQKQAQINKLDTISQERQKQTLEAALLARQMDESHNPLTEVHQ